MLWPQGQGNKNEILPERNPYSMWYERLDIEDFSQAHTGKNPFKSERLRQVS